MTRPSASVQGRPPCVACKGRSWTVEIRDVDWPEPCPRCGGTGREPAPPTLYRIALHLGEHPTTLYRLDAMRIRRAGVAWRLLKKLVRFIARNPALEAATWTP